jgi:thiamine pyrophosphokinase
VVYPAHKDETDLELALLHALAQGAERVTVLAALGGRLDMTLANIFLLTHPRLATLPIEIRHAAQRVWLIRPPGADIPGAPGDTLSLLPLAGPARGLVTHGLAYPLHGEDLLPGPARGVSNQLVSRPARVELQSGLLLAVLTAGSA